MFSRIGAAAIKKDLHNALQICETLGNPQTKFKTIHVGGTNGKGSVSHMLAAILQTAGYKTGLYTSPHLYDFRERIRVNGKMIPENCVVEFTEQMKPVIENIEPSFFEITVAMAFDYFAKEKVDVAIIEVGLGGRLDSTNIIQPELSVITNIGWDHMNMLGETLEQIAFEKAGIIKNCVPVVIGERNERSDPVFMAKANEENASIYFAEDRFSISSYFFTNTGLRINIQDKKLHKDLNVSPDLTGIYQLKNICTVLNAVEILKQNKWKIDFEDLQEALANTKKLTGLHGRWEKLADDPLTILEAAHNSNGVSEMLKHINQHNYNHLHIIFGTVKDKDHSGILKLLPKEAAYYFTQADIPRALDANSLRSLAKEYGLLGDVFKNVNAALKKARTVASQDDLVIVCGSIFLIAEVERTFPES